MERRGLERLIRTASHELLTNHLEINQIQYFFENTKVFFFLPWMHVNLFWDTHKTILATLKIA